LTKSFDDRLNLMELISRSVQDEPDSAQRWRHYDDYMYSLWICSNSTNGSNLAWSEENRVVEAEVFTWEKMAIEREALKF